MDKRVIVKLMAEHLHVDLNKVSEGEINTSELEAAAYLAEKKGFVFPYHFWWETSGRVGCREMREDLADICSLHYDSSRYILGEHSVKILDQVNNVLEENDPVLLASLHFLISRNQLKTKEKDKRINEARELLEKYKRSYFYPELKRAYDALETEGLLR